MPLQMKDPSKAIETDEMHRAYSDEVDADYTHASPQAYEAWKDLKFGMRIHWGMYSTLGLDASWPIARGNRNGDELRKLYLTQWQVFNPTEFDAEEWANLAERAGMRYFVFTSKHHDGFSMFDTKTTVQALRRPYGVSTRVGNAASAFLEKTCARYRSESLRPVTEAMVLEIAGTKRAEQDAQLEATIEITLGADANDPEGETG